MPGRIRTVKPEWLDDQRMAAASDAARVLSIALVLLADDYGNGRCTPDTMATRVYPLREMSLEGLLSISRKCHSALCELAEMRFAGLYELDGQTYFTIRNWAKHQKVNHPSKPLVPGPPDGFWDRPLEDLLSLARGPQEILLPDLRPRPTTNDQELRVSSDEKPARKRQPAKPTKPESEQPERTGYRELVDHYFVTFEARRRSRPCFGGREGKSINALLDATAGDMAKAKSIVSNAYSDPFWADKATILDIAKDPSKFVTASLNGSKPEKWGPGGGNGPQPNASDPRDRYVARRFGETDGEFEQRKADVRAGKRGAND